ncbi:LacI family DNA-binding transcriptional regulator [Roseinatronobacter alkalisoli]|uniref:Substrate-binding domain-containing protein n=1 Tax=Roseinatronobacter alkalisoli TaxID=3028235 RepID=A0ABT5T4B8_9RHOB|nr:substrate-binding domain-containing protein [Roseinatronobacter sp. HJB301]MDD7969894.1 substrate-binding domain-containing protein [Roseinatronobacter sp. HJB301]
MGVTLKELAASLNLSPTTVSRALNGYPEVNAKTRKRVRDAAERANYHPNTRARSLATGRTHAIGHVIALSDSHEIVNPVFADFIAGAGEAYSRAGYEMVLSMVPDSDEAQAYRDMIARGAVDGMIVHGPKLNDPRIALLTQLGVPFVVHGRSSGVDAPYSWLDINNNRSFRRATEFLLQLGHRRIALVNGLENMDFAMRRRNGYLQALHEAGLTPDPALMRQAEMTEVFGHSAATELMRLPDPPTAFLSSSMLVAYGLRRALVDQGCRMGRDVSVITHDDDLSYLPNGRDVPLFTATRSSVRDAGRKAAEMVLSLISAPGQGPLTCLMETTLIVGESTGPAPGSRPRDTARQ